MIPGFGFILEKADRALGVINYNNFPKLCVIPKKYTEELEHKIESLKTNLLYEKKMGTVKSNRLTEQSLKMNKLKIENKELKEELKNLKKPFERFELLDL